LVRSAGRPRAGLTRRSLLLGTLGTVGAGAVLAACGQGEKESTSGGKDPSLVRWANWPLYLDVDDAGTGHPTLEEFTSSTGIQAEYTEAIEDNYTFWDS